MGKSEKKHTYKRGERKYIYLVNLLMAAAAALMLYPVLYVVSVSVSSPWAVETGQVLFLPRNITFASYEKILSDPDIWTAYGNTLFYTVFGTCVNLFFTISGAYPLSKKNFSGRKVITFFVVLSMWFSAGIIPTFLNVKELGLYNTRMAILIAFACSTFNLILLRTYFESIPRELEEAAKLDGASEFQLLAKVYLPLSVTSLATIGLFYAVGRWNGYFWAMVLLRDDSKIPLQVLLKKLIVEGQNLEEYANIVTQTTASSNTTLTYATIVVAMLPMLVVYPFIQKYFVKGMTVGAVKG